MLIEHSTFVESLDLLKSTLPLLLNRYRTSTLSYAFMRERILSNNSLSSFEFDESYQYNLDRLNNDLSI